MNMLRLWLFGGVVLALGGCASNDAAVRNSPSGKPLPSRLTTPIEEVPAEVRRLETEIDKTAVILADEIDIHVSKNYQFDVSLIGDDVSQDLDTSGINDRVARGKAVAFVRNLQLRSDRQIRVRIASAGTEPFIRIRALGHCSHIRGAEDAQPEITRADSITIENATVRYGRLPGRDHSQPASSLAR